MCVKVVKIVLSFKSSTRSQIWSFCLFYGHKLSNPANNAQIRPKTSGYDLGSEMVELGSIPAIGARILSKPWRGNPEGWQGLPVQYCINYVRFGTVLTKIVGEN